MRTFKSNHKLTNKHQYQRVFSQAKKYRTKYITYFVYPNSLAHNRLGIAIPKKEVRFAVARNQIKRIIRESFRHHEGAISIDIVFVIYKNFLLLDKKQQREFIDGIWLKLK